jgi:hypothetical protein
MAAWRGQTDIVDGSTCWQPVGADYVNRNNGLFEGKKCINKVLRSYSMIVYNIYSLRFL